jgi:hypothetical protein
VSQSAENNPSLLNYGLARVEDEELEEFAVDKLDMLELEEFKLDLLELD